MNGEDVEIGQEERTEALGLQRLEEVLGKESVAKLSDIYVVGLASVLDQVDDSEDLKTVLAAIDEYSKLGLISEEEKERRLDTEKGGIILVKVNVNLNQTMTKLRSRIERKFGLGEEGGGYSNLSEENKEALSKEIEKANQPFYEGLRKIVSYYLEPEQEVAS